MQHSHKEFQEHLNTCWWVCGQSGYWEHHVTPPPSSVLAARNGGLYCWRGMTERGKGQNDRALFSLAAQPQHVTHRVPAKSVNARQLKMCRTHAKTQAKSVATRAHQTTYQISASMPLCLSRVITGHGYTTGQLIWTRFFPLCARTKV